MEEDRFIYYLDTRAPIIRRSVNGASGSVDVATINAARLRVRPQWSDEVVIDQAMTKDTAANQLVYAPKSGDFSTEGSYRAWVNIDFGASVKQDIDEFEIIVLAHAPGDTVRIGEIWRAARALAPVAWDALRGYEEYGDPELQRIINLAKLRVLTTTVDAVHESGLDPRVIDYIAKKVLVDNVLEAAISYWTNVIVSQTALGNSAEVKTYPDRIRATEGTLERLRAQLIAQKPEVDDLIGSPTGALTAGPILIGGGLPVTPDLGDVLCSPYERYERWSW